MTSRLPTVSVDLLVLGSGMAGSTVGAHAVQLGVTTLVVEVADKPGGSAAISGGNVWTVATEDEFRREDPDGDVERWRVLREGLDAGLDWVESLGVATSRSTPKVHDAPVGRNIDVQAFLARCQGIIEGAGHPIVCRTTSSRLLTEDGRVTGAVLSESGREVGAVRAKSVVLATGGFQASPVLRGRYLFPGAEALLLRGNHHSTGGGIQLALDVGAAFTTERRSFYGQLVPSPLVTFEEPEFRSLAMFFSVFGLLMRRDGRRWIDESVGSHKNADAVGVEGTALLVIDDRMRATAQEQYGTDPAEVLHRAAGLECRMAQVDRLEDLGPHLDAWGFSRRTALETIADFGRAVRAGTPPRDAPRSRHRLIADRPPFWALEVQPAITIAYAGLVTDLDGRVLREDGDPIEGLFAVGVDAAGPNVAGYSGSLSRGLVFGRRLARRLARA